MAKFILVNRRAGLFTDTAKHASRAAVASALGMFGTQAKVVADHNPTDMLARRVVVFEADAANVAAMQSRLAPDAIIEPLVYRQLHHQRRPASLRRAAALDSQVLKTAKSSFILMITAGGRPLGGIDVIAYVRDSAGSPNPTMLRADANGRVQFSTPHGGRVVAVRPIPYADYWSMMAKARGTRSTVDCLPLVKAGPDGNGWWHDVMRVNTVDRNRGRDITVGLLDTGCGPHPNLEHVKRIGAFTDGGFQPGAAATDDVVEHGSHTTGIIGARPKRPGDYAGMAPNATLVHARVFKGVGPDEGPSNSDLINAIDALSRDHNCDLINMSLGGGQPTQAEQDAIRDAAERGTLCVCSAGNAAGPIDYPAAYMDCAAVSAIGQSGWAPSGSFSWSIQPQDADKLGSDDLFLARTSCFAAAGQTLACTAPGVGIISTVPDKDGRSGQYMVMDGTSMASPVACGALAVILGRNKAYKALPRNQSRSDAARATLAQHCCSIGLDVKYEGRGLPRL